MASCGPYRYDWASSEEGRASERGFSRIMSGYDRSNIPMSSEHIICSAHACERWIVIVVFMHFEIFFFYNSTFKHWENILVTLFLLFSLSLVGSCGLRILAILIALMFKIPCSRWDLCAGCGRASKSGKSCVSSAASVLAHFHLACFRSTRSRYSGTLSSYYYLLLMQVKQRAGRKLSCLEFSYTLPPAFWNEMKFLTVVIYSKVKD